MDMLASPASEVRILKFVVRVNVRVAMAPRKHAEKKNKTYKHIPTGAYVLCVHVRLEISAGYMTGPWLCPYGGFVGFM